MLERQRVAEKRAEEERLKQQQEQERLKQLQEQAVQLLLLLLFDFLFDLSV